MTTYTAEQIKTGDYDFAAIFGYTVANPLPWRAVGFSETSTDGIFESQIMCQETREDLDRIAPKWFDYKLYAVYHFDGANWVRQESAGRL